jgi:hypothetical protein
MDNEDNINNIPDFETFDSFDRYKRVGQTGQTTGQTGQTAQTHRFRPLLAAHVPPFRLVEKVKRKREEGRGLVRGILGYLPVVGRMV